MTKTEEITFADRIPEDSEDFAYLQKAFQKLELVHEASPRPTPAQWNVQQGDNSDPVYQLTLSDCTGSITRQIMQSELRSPHLTTFHLYPSFGDLLGIDIDRRIKKMLSSGECGDEGHLAQD